MRILLDNANVLMWVEDNSEPIIHAKYKSGANLTLTSAEEIVKCRLNYQNKSVFKGIAYISHFINISAEARQYFCSEGLTGIEKLAIVTDSKVINVMATIMLTFNKPSVPSRIFQEPTAAIQWIKYQECPDIPKK